MDVWDDLNHIPPYLRDDLPDENELPDDEETPICIYCEQPLEPDEAIKGICLTCRKLGLGGKL